MTESVRTVVTASLNQPVNGAWVILVLETRKELASKKQIDERPSDLLLPGQRTAALWADVVIGR